MTNPARSLFDEVLCAALVAGALLVLLVPSARATVAIGWLPMWLVAMPAVAWWALRGFPLPHGVRADARPARASRSRRPQPQARRAVRPGPAAPARRAA